MKETSKLENFWSTFYTEIHEGEFTKNYYLRYGVLQHLYRDLIRKGCTEPFDPVKEIENILSIRESFTCEGLAKLCEKHGITDDHIAGRVAQYLATNII